MAHRACWSASRPKWSSLLGPCQCGVCSACIEHDHDISAQPRRRARRSPEAHRRTSGVEVRHYTTYTLLASRCYTKTNTRSLAGKQVHLPKSGSVGSAWVAPTVGGGMEGFLSYRRSTRAWGNDLKRLPSARHSGRGAHRCEASVARYALGLMVVGAGCR
jgi:hypothetical protein